MDVGDDASSQHRWWSEIVTSALGNDRLADAETNLSIFLKKTSLRVTALMWHSESRLALVISIQVVCCTLSWPSRCFVKASCSGRLVRCCRGCWCWCIVAATSSEWRRWCVENVTIDGGRCSLKKPEQVVVMWWSCHTLCNTVFYRGCWWWCTDDVSSQHRWWSENVARLSLQCRNDSWLFSDDVT